MVCFASVPIFISARLLNKAENIPSIRQAERNSVSHGERHWVAFIPRANMFGALERPLNFFTEAKCVSEML